MGLDSKEECCQASNDKPEAAPLVGTQTKEAPPPEDPPEDTGEDEKQKSNAALLARIEETKKKTQDAANHHTASSDSGSGAGSGTGSGSGAGSGSGSSGNPDRNIAWHSKRGMASCSGSGAWVSGSGAWCRSAITTSSLVNPMVMIATGRGRAPMAAS